MSNTIENLTSPTELTFTHDDNLYSDIKTVFIPKPVSLETANSNIQKYYTVSDTNPVGYVKIVKPVASKTIGDRKVITPSDNSSWGYSVLNNAYCSYKTVKISNSLGISSNSKYYIEYNGETSKNSYATIGGNGFSLPDGVTITQIKNSLSNESTTERYTVSNNTIINGIKVNTSGRTIQLFGKNISSTQITNLNQISNQYLGFDNQNNNYYIYLQYNNNRYKIINWSIDYLSGNSVTKENVDTTTLKNVNLNTDAKHYYNLIKNFYNCFTLSNNYSLVINSLYMLEDKNIKYFYIPNGQSILSNIYYIGTDNPTISFSGFTVKSLDRPIYV